jgi:hypothetical protein
MRRNGTAATARRPDRLLLLAAAALVLALVALALLRVPIVSAAPGLASLYARLGAPVNVRGLDFRNVATTRDSVAGAPGVAVEGEIVNVARGAADVPPIRLTLENASGKVVATWNAEAERHRLGVGESTRFRTRLAAPPDAGKLVLDFGRADGSS